MIPTQRHLFDLPDDLAWLNCGYMSPLMVDVAGAGRAGIERKVHPWTVSPRDFFTDTERARDLFARILNATADDVAIVPAASYGVACAARNLPLARGQKVLLLHDQFPSNVYPWRALAAERGAEVVTVARPADARWTEAVLEAIDARTAIVALPHCHWTDGALLDLERIGARCRAEGAALALDLTQSLGALPFDVERVRPDFAVAASYKWLLGPYSIGFLYVAPRWHGGEPIEHNWIDRAGSEDFSRLVDYRDDFQPGARRYDMGERTNFVALPMANLAMERILDWGVEAIAQTLAARTASIAGPAASLGLESIAPPLRAGHYLGLRFPGGMPAGLPEALAERRVHVSVRGDAVRVTPHLYNTDADVERLLDALEAVL